MSFELINSFFAEGGAVAAQHESFNALVFRGIHKIINDTPAISTSANGATYSVRFLGMYVDYPSVLVDGTTVRRILPAEARQRNLNYDAPVFMDIAEDRYDAAGKLVSHKLHSHIQAFRLPIMVGSVRCNLYDKTPDELIAAGECPADFGGYFIINGKERVLVGQERIGYNTVHVFADNSGKYRFVAEIRSMSDETSHSVLVQACLTQSGDIVFSIPKVAKPVPAAIVLAAHGMAADEIAALRGVPAHADAETAEKAVAALAALSSTQHLPEIFPHMGGGSPQATQALLRHMISRLMSVATGAKREDDRDHVAMRRLELPGVLVGDLLKMHFKKFIETVRRTIAVRQDIACVLQKLADIGKGIKYCFATGNWGVQKNSYIRSGVSQILSRLSYAATVSHIRRIVLPVDKDGKNAKIRQIHPTQFGMVCVFETPEGMQVGTVKNMALFTRTSQFVSHHLVTDIVSREVAAAGATLVLVNGSLVGYTDAPDALVARLRRMRQQCIIDGDVSIVYKVAAGEVFIACDECRLVRPLLVVSDGKLPDLARPWSALVAAGDIVYRDATEIEYSHIAMEYSDVSSETMYCEISPLAMLGTCAASIPFSDHNQSARNCFQSSMMKQAIGMPVLNYNERTETMLHVMHYTQRPLVSTVVARAAGLDDMPSGINAIVAIACYTGFNQEDSVIINQSAIDRGLFVSSSYKTVTYEERRLDTTSYEVVGVPTTLARHGKWYRNLDAAGIAARGSKVVKGDVLIAKSTVVNTRDGVSSVRDSSITAAHDQEGIVHKVVCTTTGEGYRLIKIVIRQEKIPEIGDKFASRSAQKGTLGMTFRSEDMPFTADGIVPDIIINPNAIPSRMTIAQLLECVLGKSGALQGRCSDATAFSPNSVDVASTVCDRLEQCGFDRDGNEVMYNGMTGEQIKARIFIGPTYYQRLKHLVSDKMHARAEGDVQILTNQPLEGRSRGGGLRLGEMERDALIAHGTSGFLRERLYTMSDPYEVPVCNTCGAVAAGNMRCRSCNSDSVCRVQIPYATRLLFTELEAMSVKVAIKPK